MKSDTFLHLYTVDVNTSPSGEQTFTPTFPAFINTRFNHVRQLHPERTQGGGPRTADCTTFCVVRAALRYSSSVLVFVSPRSYFDPRHVKQRDIVQPCHRAMLLDSVCACVRSQNESPYQTIVHTNRSGLLSSLILVLYLELHVVSGTRGKKCLHFNELFLQGERN